jgi:HD-GYP domain-containing protein (c-di-GMP phosphodiesterase class II)
MAATPIAVEELRVGMYIQLDGGWLSHPFPLSSFRIAGPDQIQTLRGLGLGRVRWVPEKSLLVPTSAETADGVVPNAADATAAAIAAADLEALAGVETEAAQPPAAALSTAERAVLSRAEWLAAQRESARVCERQYGEASNAWRGAMDALAARPQEAGSTSRQLTQAMLDKMLAAEDVGIRLVSGGGDRNAAHALNVTVIALLIGRTLGLDADELADLGVGALMHDVGKQDVAERYRHGDDGFTSSEMAAYREHVVKGVVQGRRMGLTPGAMAVLAQHHEHADGSGFPTQMGADRMAMGARIVAIVDRYDKLCNPGSSALAMTPHQAVAMLFAQGRQRYDTTVLNTFIRMMGVYPAGSLVQLTDDRYAMVVGVNSSRPLKPRVLVHNGAGLASASASTPWRGAAPAGTEMLDLEQIPDLGIRRSLAPAKVPSAALQSLDPRPRVAYYFEPIAREAHHEALAA